MTNKPQALDEQMIEPCPFCGGEANGDGYARYNRPLEDTRWADGSEITECFFVNCIKCGISNGRPGLVGGYQTKAEAIAAWNARAAHSLIAAKVAELEEAHEAIKASNEYIERLQAYVVATEQFLLTQDGVICGLSGGTHDPGRGAKKAWERFVNAREIFAELQDRAALAPHPEGTDQ